MAVPKNCPNIRLCIIMQYQKKWYHIIYRTYTHTHTHIYIYIYIYIYYIYIYIYIIYSYVCVAIISCLSKHSTTPLVTPPPKWKPLFSIPAIYRPELKWTRWLVCTGCNGANWNKQGSIADLAATSLKKNPPDGETWLCRKLFARGVAQQKLIVPAWGHNKPLGLCTQLKHTTTY